MATVDELRQRLDQMGTAVQQLIVERDAARAAAAAAVPASNARFASILGVNVSELQKLSKPSKIKDQDGYIDWLSDFESYMNLINPIFGETIDEVKEDLLVPWAPSDDTEREVARVMYHTLTGITQGLAKKIIKSQTDKNGVEAFRKLHMRMSMSDDQGETS